MTLSSRSLQLVTKGRAVLPRILIAMNTPLSTSASVYSASEERSVHRADKGSNSSPRVQSQQRASPESYQRARRGPFSQPMPQLHNPFIEDPFLRTCLSNMLPPQVSHYHQLALVLHARPDMVARITRMHGHQTLFLLRLKGVAFQTIPNPIY